MKCNGRFIFRGLDKKDGGEFTNERGQAIKYDGSYVLKLDEVTEEGVYERKLKFPLKNTSLLDKVKNLKVYDEINVNCDVAFFNNQVKLIPIDVSLVVNK